MIMHVNLSIRDTKNGGVPSRHIREIPCVIYGEGKSFVKTNTEELTTLGVYGKEEDGALVLIGDLGPYSEGNVAAMFFKDARGIDNMIEILNIAKAVLEKGKILK